MMREHQHEEKTARHLDRLLEALDSGVPSQVKKLINSLNGAEIGDLLESLPQSRRQIVWDLVKVDLDGDVLVEVNDEVRAGLIRDTAPDDLIQAMGELDLDDLADILNDLPDAVITEVLRAMDRQDRERLAQVMSYPEDSAGGLMNPDVVTVRPDVSLDVVLRYLRVRGELPEVFDQLFVVNRAGKHLGQLKISDVLTHDPSSLVSDLIDKSTDPLPVDMPTSIHPTPISPAAAAHNHPATGKGTVPAGC